jgi:hypothetical protein
MYIQPNTNIILLQGVPLDNTYTDTIYFADATAQYNHFLTYTSMMFPAQSYQRVNKGTLRLQVTADNIYNYNYLMFRNASYGQKWFYAFINKINYINDNTSEIEYELDVMQTWMFEAILEPSYVEREHSATDIIGENIAPEPVNIGDIRCTDIIRWNSAWGLDDYALVVFHAPYHTGGDGGDDEEPTPEELLDNTDQDPEAND